MQCFTDILSSSRKSVRSMLATPSMSVFLHFVISNYLQTSRCLLVFSDVNFDVPIENMFVRINVVNGTFPIDVLFRSHGCDDILIQTQKPSEFLDYLEEVIRRHKERFFSRRYFIISDGSKEEFEDFFSGNYLKFITDVLYVFPKTTKRFNEIGFGKVDDDIVYELWTHEFGGRGNNFKNPKLVDVWFSSNSSFLYNRYLYPDKISNQNGKALKVAAITYPPYTVIGESAEETDGTEMRYAKVFAEKHNMTFELVVNEEELWGDIYKNWTGNGILGEMVLDESDFGIAAIYQWEIVYEYLEMSKPTIRAGVSCIVPAPKLSAGWLMPLFSYTTSMWIAVGLAFLLSALCLSLLESKSIRFPARLEASVFTVLIIFMQQSLSDIQLKKHFSIKVFVLSLLVLSLFISASYSSGLASSMTIPRYDDPIRTVEDLGKSGIYWSATTKLFVNAIQNSKEEKYERVLQKFVVWSEQEQAEKAKTHLVGFIFERTPFGHYAAIDFITKETVSGFNLMIEDLYWAYCVFATRRNSVLLRPLDKLILQIAQSGILHYWESKVTEKSANIKIQKILYYLATHHDKKSEYTSLKWTHVQGAFGILTIGIATALACFIFELIVFRL